MINIPVTTALERQVPEHIREEYDTFVRFLKAYYRYVEDNYGRKLEDIRSIDKTLDEFIVNFKKELAASVPTRSLPNEKAFLEHIKDFYNSRGSIESYKLLFRILFNKEVDVFYPSTQILKASDGKWVQEKSVFVRLSKGSLHNLRGKIINIVTDRKTLRVFCPNVVLYRDDVYEVFIDKQYYSDIEIGDIVELDGDSGNIVACPSGYKIVKEGSGFEAGAIYNLPTSTGTGSVVKITRVGSNGEIKRLQVISFGLDYETNFYATLSNKTHAALVYYHPVTAYYAGTPRDTELEPKTTYPIGYPINPENPPSSSVQEDFVDFGYIINQSYLYYDIGYFPINYSDSDDIDNPPLGDVIQSNWYVDATYVGDIVASFYTNEVGNAIDDTAAEIKITLGPVAAYPGYYETNDGFLSDESYIQDGKYYQLFSYVIKVEETLDNYSDIVKSILHPGGLRLYGQYNILNNFLVEATPLLAFVRLQLADYIADGDIILDTGTPSSTFRFKSMEKPLDELPILFENAFIESKEVRKGETWDEINGWTPDPITDSLQALEDIFKHVSKPIEELNQLYLLTSDEDTFKNITKRILLDPFGTPVDSISKKEVDKLLQEYPTLQHSPGLFWEFASIAGGSFYQTAEIDHSPGLSWSFASIAGGSFYQTAEIDHSPGLSWSFASNSGGSFYQTAEIDHPGLSWSFSSIAGGTFYQTAQINETYTPIFYKEINKNKDTDYFDVLESFNKTVEYKRAEEVNVYPTETIAQAFTRGTIEEATSLQQTYFNISYLLELGKGGVEYATLEEGSYQRALSKLLQELAGSVTYSESIAKHTQKLLQELAGSVTYSEALGLRELYLTLDNLINNVSIAGTLYANPYNLYTAENGSYQTDYFSQEYAVVDTRTLT